MPWRACCNQSWEGRLSWTSGICSSAAMSASASRLRCLTTWLLPSRSAMLHRPLNDMSCWMRRAVFAEPSLLSLDLRGSRLNHHGSHCSLWPPPACMHGKEAKSCLGGLCNPCRVCCCRPAGTKTSNRNTDEACWSCDDRNLPISRHILRLVGCPGSPCTITSHDYGTTLFSMHFPGCQSCMGR